MPDQQSTKARWDALADPGTQAELLTRCRASVVRTVWVDRYVSAHHLLPYTQETMGELPASYRDAPGADTVEAGLDAEGRLVLITSADWNGEPIHDCVVREPGLAERARFSAAGPDELETATLGDDGRVLEVWEWRRGDGDEPYHQHHRCYHDESGRPVLTLRVYGHGAGGTRFTYGDDGELALVEEPRLEGDYTGADGWETARREAMLVDAGTPTWDARIHRRETDLPAPGDAFTGLAEPIAHAVAAALAAVRERIGTLAFVAVGVSPESDVDGPPLLTASAAGVAYRRRAVATVDDAADVVRLSADGGPDTAVLPVLDHCSAELLRALRAGHQAAAADADDPDSYGRHARAAGSRLAVELAVELDRLSWPAADDAFVAIVRGPDDWRVQMDADADGDWDDEEWDDDEEDGWDEEDDEDTDDAGRGGPALFPTLRAAIGDARADAALVALTPVGSSAGGTRRPLEVADRDALAGHLVEGGLDPADAERVAQEAAAWGILLTPGGSGVSRLGGLPVLEAGTPWPSRDGRPLTHLATIALDELPDVEGRDALPADGLLSFFADLSEAGEFWEPVELHESDTAVILRTAAGVTTYEPQAPQAPDAEEHDAPIRLEELRVRATPRLQLREFGFGFAERTLGIDAVGEHLLVATAERINGEAHAQLLGYPPVVQDDPREDGQVAVFHLAHAPDIGFEFLDGGDVLFYADEADVRDGRWERATAWPSSC